MDSNIFGSNAAQGYYSRKGSVPYRQILPGLRAPTIKPTFYHKGAHGPPLVPNRLQSDQAPAYNGTQDQPINKVNQPMFTAQCSELFSSGPGPTGTGVTCTRYPYHQIELDDVWRRANVNIESVFEGLKKIDETDINMRKRVTRNLMVDKEHNYLSMPEELGVLKIIGPDFILNGAPLYNKYLEKKSQDKDWEKKMQMMHLQLRKLARNKSLNYVAGDLNRVKSTGAFKNLDEQTEAKHQRSNICRLDQVYEAATQKKHGTTHLIDNEILVKQIMALNELEKNITNATQSLMKEMALAIYKQMQDDYSFGKVHDVVVHRKKSHYSQVAKLSSKYAYCCFLLNFVLKKLTDHLDCDDVLKEKLMEKVMENRNLEFDDMCKFEKTFLPRIYLEAKRRLKQTPSMHMKKHKIILDRETATSATAYAVSALVGMDQGVMVQTGGSHRGRVVHVDTEATSGFLNADDQSMSQSVSLSMSSSAMVAQDLNKIYDTVTLPKVDHKAKLLPFRQQANKEIPEEQQVSTSGDVPSGDVSSGVGCKTSTIEHQTDQGLSVGDEPSFPAKSKDKAVVQEGLSVGDEPSLPTKSQDKAVVQEKTVLPACADNLDSKKNDGTPSSLDSTVTEDVTKVPKQSTIALKPYKSDRTLQDIFCHREECRQNPDSKMKSIATHAGHNVKNAIEMYHVNSAPCGFGYSECVFESQNCKGVSEKNTKEVLVEEEQKAITEMLNKSLESDVKKIRAGVTKGSILGKGDAEKIRQKTKEFHQDVQSELQYYQDRVKGRHIFGQLNDEKVMKKYGYKFKDFVFICDNCLKEESSNPVCCCKFCLDAAQSLWDKKNRTGSPTEKRTRSNTKRNRSATINTVTKKQQRENRSKRTKS